MANRIMLNETSYHGSGAIEEIATEAKAHGLRKHLFVLIRTLSSSELLQRLQISLIRMVWSMRFIQKSNQIQLLRMFSMA